MHLAVKTIEMYRRIDTVILVDVDQIEQSKPLSLSHTHSYLARSHFLIYVT